MAWTTAKVDESIFGDKRIEIHSWTATGVTGGDIVTGLTSILHVDLSNATGKTADEAYSTSGGTVTVSGVTASDSGTLFVIGR